MKTYDAKVYIMIRYVRRNYEKKCNCMLEIINHKTVIIENVYITKIYDQKT